MTWRAVVSAIDDGEAFRSRVNMYLHPLAGRPLLWHVVSVLLETSPPPQEVVVVYSAEAARQMPGLPDGVVSRVAEPGGETRALRAAVTLPGQTVLVDGAAPLLTSGTIARLLRAAQGGVAMIPAREEHLPGVAVAGEGPALASAEDPRHPVGSSRVPPTQEVEQLRVVDRHSLAEAAVVVRDRLVRSHELRGVSFLLPGSVLIDMDVRIGPDTTIYPGVVLEGATEIGRECVIGPCSRIVESTIGRGTELEGWNFLVRTQVRNHAVLEAYSRRGVE